MESEEDIKKKRMEARKAQEQLKTTLRSALEENAYNRLMNVSLVNEEIYLTAAQNIIMAFKRVRRKITEKELLSVLNAINEQKETKITFHKK